VKDTPLAIERKFRQMILKRSGAERLKMGCSMYAAARALAKAGLLQRYPRVHPAELKRLLFLHFYGAEFEPEQRNRIASALSKSARRSKATQARVREASALGKPETRTQVAERPTAYRTKRPIKSRLKGSKF
jgi:hypothetical protein